MEFKSIKASASCGRVRIGIRPNTMSVASSQSFHYFRNNIVCICHHEDYYFDYVFSPGATEDEISGEFLPLIRDALHGDSTLIGTYGEQDILD